MSVRIEGVKNLNANNFNEIVVLQNDENDYIVKVLGNKINTVNNKFSMEIKDMSDEDKIVAIIQRYLDNFKINSVNAPIFLSDRDGKWIVIGGFGNNVLKLRLFGSKFNNIFNIIRDKYLNDRYDYFWNEDINSVKLRLDSDCSSYNVGFVDCDDCKNEEPCYISEDNLCESYVELAMKTDRNGNGVVDFEKDFIKEFLYHKFSQIGEEVKVMGVFLEFTDSHNRILKSHIVQCGDFKLYFPHKDEFMFILGIVNDYNNELFKVNNDIKKRQLIMEEF